MAGKKDDLIRAYVDGVFSEARTKRFWSQVQLPSYIAAPEPGQDIDNDCCPWVSFFRATIRDVQTFLSHEPDWLNENTVAALGALVEYALRDNEVDDNFVSALDIKKGGL